MKITGWRNNLLKNTAVFNLYYLPGALFGKGRGKPQICVEEIGCI